MDRVDSGNEIDMPSGRSGAELGSSDRPQYREFLLSVNVLASLSKGVERPWGSLLCSASVYLFPFREANHIASQTGGGRQ